MSIKKRSGGTAAVKKKRSRLHGREALASLVLLFTLGGCGSESGIAPPVLQTEILAVHVEPNPVEQGDSTVLTVVIEDSLDHRFEYRWHIEGQPLIYSDASSVVWLAEAAPNTYSAIVRADNGDAFAEAPSEVFSITVVEEDST